MGASRDSRVGMGEWVRMFQLEFDPPCVRVFFYPKPIWHFFFYYFFFNKINFLFFFNLREIYLIYFLDSYIYIYF